jgi:CRP/FNR family transcriptional regulator, nitrogen oxide reductase regulator
VELLRDDMQLTPECPALATQRILAMIGQCPLFQGLSSQASLELAQCALDLTFTASAVLFTAGARATTIYALASGTVKRSILAADGSEVLVQLLGPGELLGWYSVLSNDFYQATARAIGQVHTLGWEKQEFEDLLQRLPALSRNALSMLARRLLEQQQEYLQLATEQAPQRLARALLRLKEACGHHSDDESPAEIPLSRAELAQIAGTSLFTVSRMLSLWDSQRLLRARRGRVIIENPRALGRIAEAHATSPSCHTLHAEAE